MFGYSIVVATRNRINALEISINLFLQQSRLPQRIIVVDSSDDHPSIALLCDAISRKYSFPIEVIKSEYSNLPYQRNIGLDLVEDEVIIYPDDDSFWYPDTAERMLAVYERDTSRLIGGVTGIETNVSPIAPQTNSPRKTRRLVQRPNIERLRGKIESRLFPAPFNLHGNARIAELAPAARAAGLNETFVETMGGYRMSFRTEVIRRLRFDETLGYGIGYAIHEDKDLSLRVMNAGYLLAAAKGARVFHNVHPGKRAQGFFYGFYHLLNYIYIMRKITCENEGNSQSIKRYLSYKVFLYKLRSSNEYNNDVYLGAHCAMKYLDTIMSAPLQGLTGIYEDICAKEWRGATPFNTSRTRILRDAEA